MLLSMCRTSLLILLLLSPAMADMMRQPTPTITPAQLVSSAPSGDSTQLLQQLEQLMQNSAHQERAFTHSWLRYLTVVMQHGEQQRAARFLLRLSQRHPTAWVRGAALVSDSLAQSARLSDAFGQRMLANIEQPLLTVNMIALYELALPRLLADARQDKIGLIDALGSAWGEGFDTGSLIALAQTHQRPIGLAPPSVNSSVMQQALQQSSPAILVAALAQYYQQLIATNTLSHGLIWLDQQTLRHPAVPLIEDLLKTTRQNQQIFLQAQGKLQLLRQDQPASMQLALSESLLQFHNPTGRAELARQVLQQFRQHFPPDPTTAQLLNTFDRMLMGTETD